MERITGRDLEALDFARVTGKITSSQVAVALKTRTDTARQRIYRLERHGFLVRGEKPRFGPTPYTVTGERVVYQNLAPCGKRYLKAQLAANATTWVTKRPVVDGQKQCPNCELWKPATEKHFRPTRDPRHKGINPRPAGGLRPYCRECEALASRWRQADKRMHEAPHLYRECQNEACGYPVHITKKRCRECGSAT